MQRLNRFGKEHNKEVEGVEKGHNIGKRRGREEKKIWCKDYNGLITGNFGYLEQLL